ncbi:MAG: hypothetical protein AB7L66_03940 [Gemmatimonadales bacterium]
MPRASVWLIRAALLHLVVASGLGAWFLVAKAGGPLPPPRLLSTHAAIALIGWLAQLTIGVAHWILPKHAAGEARGPALFPWLAFAMLNGGLLATALAPLAPGLRAGGLAAALAGIVSFLAGALPRVKAFGTGRPTSSRTLS